VRNALREANYYARTALGIYKFLRAAPVSDPEGTIRRQLERREAVFLDTVRRVCFSNPRNPYHEMFRLAGCAFEELEESVGKDGLETTLAALRRQGVHLTHDEFKGKTPIVRSGQHIPAKTGDFRNPLVAGLMTSQTGGSRSAGTRTPRSLQHQRYIEAHHALRWRELGLSGRPHVEVMPVLPSMAGLGSCLRIHRQGSRVERWFAVGGMADGALHYRLMTLGMAGFANLLGAGIPMPVALPPNDFSSAAEWIFRRAGCVVQSYPSIAVRIAAAALEKGLDLSGTTFLVAGEALTGAKRAVIQRAGAEAYPSYPITEIGPVGYACRQMNSGNCVHLFSDSIAVISHRQRAPLTEVEVDALLFTTLLPFAPHVLINAEMGDTGIIEPARCDCLLSRVGFTRQVRDIGSYGKLTGQGMTLVGTEVGRILEEILPAQLGGSPGDYQLVEREGGIQTQLSLRVSPRTGLSSPQTAQECFLREIGRLHGGKLAARVWKHTQGLEVVIAEPLSTATGKVHPLHLMASGVKGSHAA